MLSEPQLQSLRRSWELVEPVSDTVADLFYKRLFEIAPQYRVLFPEDLREQKKKLMATIRFLVRSLDYPDDAWREPVPPNEDLFFAVLNLGKKHSGPYRVPDSAYAAVGEALLWTFDYGLGAAFTPETKAVWTAVYTLAAKAMQMGRTVPGGQA